MLISEIDFVNLCKVFSFFQNQEFLRANKEYNLIKWNFWLFKFHWKSSRNMKQGEQLQIGIFMISTTVK